MKLYMAYSSVDYESGTILGLFRTNEKALGRIQEYKDTYKAITGRFPSYENFYVECINSGESINLTI